MDSAAVRARMVERLRADGIAASRCSQAFGEVQRHRFVDTALATQAYEDTSLPIGHGQTISKPSVVARMLALFAAARRPRARAVAWVGCSKSAPAAATRRRCWRAAVRRPGTGRLWKSAPRHRALP
jgi:protein-L-isoaspartate O-methyltransferase